MTTTTLDFHGAQLIVPTVDLISAWIEKNTPLSSNAPTTCVGYAAPLHLLNPGERYVGLFGTPDGRTHHTILLPFDRDDATWDEQMAWAKSNSVELPNRLENLMMWMTMRERFQKAAYWSCDVHHEDSAFAWYQCFGYGGQVISRKGAALRAVAVRRSPIQPFTHS